MKRFLCALLAIAMLASIIVVPVSAEADTSTIPTPGTTLCQCGCGLPFNEIQWSPWNPNTVGSATNGHFYLENDYTHTKQYQVNSGMRVVLDLRGHKLTTQKSRLFLVYGYVAVIDTVGGGRLCASSTGTANGGAVMVAWDAVAMNDELDATFAMYNCTATLEKDKQGLKGGLFNISDHGTLKIVDSTILSASSKEMGGAIYTSGSNSLVSMENSRILGCSAGSAGGAIYSSSGNITLKNCTLIGNKATTNGGNIYCSGGNLTLENTSVESGISYGTSNGGGNIFTTSNCKVTMTDSTVRNGYAVNNGGNIFFGKGTQNLTNTKITAGVSGNQGANLYCADSAAVTTLDNCEIPGSVYYANGSLTLKGSTKIGLGGSGLALSGAALNTSGLTGQVYTTSDGYCPHCKQQVTWAAAGTSLSGHCYLTADTTLTEAYTITSDTVLDLRGYDITSSDRAFTVSATGSLTLLDSAGGATVTGSGNADGLGGVISNAGTLRIYAGNYVYTANASKPLTKGGVIYTAGPTEIHGGFFDGSAFNYTTSGCQGGALYLASKTGAFTVSAGYFAGGTAHTAGTMYLAANNTLTFTGGHITGGSAAASSGNIYISGGSASTAAGTANISGLVITDGTATTNGGNMGIAYYKNVQMENCFISGGTTTTTGSSSAGKGGNIYFTTSSYTTLTDCVLLNGNAGSSGGNAHTNSNTSTVTFVDCLLADGSATTYGGNLATMNTLVTVKGGMLAYGTATTTGGNISNSAGSNDDDCLVLQADSNGNAPILTGGSATTYGGNLYTSGKLNLDAALMVNGKAVSGGADLYYGNTSYAMLTVGTGLAGTVHMGVASAHLSGNAYGGTITKSAATTLNADIYLEGYENAPPLCVSDNKLCVGAATVKTADGKEIWYGNATTAAAACPDNGWIKLYADATLALTQDTYVDLGGKTLTVSGNYTLYGMDSSGDDFTVGTGLAICDEGIKTELRTVAPDGKTYISIDTDAGVTYHRLDMRLTDVTLRPAECGVYYKGVWNCDSQLETMISNFGIAVSVYHMPDSGFATDKDVLTADYDSSLLSLNKKQAGVLIKNIMKDTLASAFNAARGNMPIYATAYLKMNDGTLLLSDTPNSEDDIAYSLKTAMERMDQLLVNRPILYTGDTVDAARAFYATWKTKGMQSWAFDRLKEPEDDGVLKIIILGSSRSVNTFQLLYEAFKDQMPDQELELGIMYYSGCSMTMHERFIKENQAVYHYYHNDNGRWVITPGMDMASGLRAENWDVVLLQAGTGDQSKQMQLDTRIFLNSYIDQQMHDPYELWWHSTWFNSTDPDLYKPPKTAEDAAAVDQIAQLTSTNNAAKAYVLNDPMFAGHITSGTPMMYALKCLNVAEKDLFRDHTHLSDFGCLLVAYAWYAQYTGKPVTQINIDTIPVYLRHKDYQSLGDMTVTEEMKQIILETVEYTMDNLWAVPGGTDS